MDLVTRINRPRRPQLDDIPTIRSNKRIEQAFLQTFDILGGVDGLTAWAAASPENYGEYLKMLVKFAPKALPDAQKSGNVIEYRSNIPPSPLNGAGTSPISDGEFIPVGKSE